MRRSTAIPIALLSVAGLGAVPAAAWAQSREGPAVFAAVSVHWLWDDESFLGRGVAAGGGISVPLTERVILRARVMRSHNKRDFKNGVVFQNDATRYTAEALWTFSDGPSAAYAGVGIGGFTFDRESIYGPNPQDPLGLSDQTTRRFTSSGTELIGGGIAGFTAVSKGRFRLQPEISIWLSSGYHIAVEGTLLAGWMW